MPGSTALHQACRIGDEKWAKQLLEQESRAKRRTSCESVRLSGGAKRSEQDKVVRKRAKRASRDRRSLVRAKEAKMREQALLNEEDGGKQERKHRLIKKVVNSALIELITAEEANEGQTPFHLACEFGHVDIVKHLVACLRESFVIPYVLPFVINYTDFRGWTPLHCAASMGHLDLCQVLLDAKADASALADISNTSPLHMLLRCERLTQEPLHKLKDVIEGMLQNGASINGLNTYGETALHFACWKGNARAVAILLKNGAHVHSVNKRGETCLHYATRQGDVKIIELLVKHGADINALGDCGTAADVARSHHQDHIASFMDSFLTLRSLPDELLVKVLGFLDAEDLSAVGLVCKRFFLITDESRLWKKAYGELVPQQFALSQCDDYKAECKKWLRLHLSSEWYREARKEGRWRFDCPRNDEDWVYDRFFRVALVGDVGTGKRSFLTRFVDDAYLGSRALRKSMTKTKAIHHNNRTIKLQMFSASGFHYEGRESCDLKSIKGALLFFDVSDMQSFQNLSFWCQHLQRLAPPDIPVVVVATKVDLVQAPAVSYAQAKQWCDMRAFPLVSASALKGLNVDVAMRHLVKRLMAKDQEGSERVHSAAARVGTSASSSTRSSPRGGLRSGGSRHKGGASASAGLTSGTSSSQPTGGSGGDSSTSGSGSGKGGRTSGSKRMAKSAGEAMKASKRDRRKEVKRAATDGSMHYRRRDDRRESGEDHPASQPQLPPPLPPLQEKKQRRLDAWENDVLRRVGNTQLERPPKEKKDDAEEGLFNSDDIIIPSITVPPKKKSIMHFWRRIG